MTFEHAIVFLVSFVTTGILTPKMINYAKRVGVTGVDMHKKDKTRIAELGGVAVIAGIISGLFALITYTTFIEKISINTEYFFVAISTVLISTIVGLIDDFPRRTGPKQGLRQYQKLILTFTLVIPLMAINAGFSKMSLPFIGVVELGILYPLIFIPLFLVFSANAVNLLGGFNGLETSLSLITAVSLWFYAYFTGAYVSTLLLTALIASLISFFKYNWIPAKIFPGDTFTYTVGAVLGVSIILGNMERFGILIMIPYGVEFLLKLRSRMQAECYGLLQDDNTLKPRYKKIYSLTHVVMKLLKPTEKQLVMIMSGIFIIHNLLIWAITILFLPPFKPH